MYVAFLILYFIPAGFATFLASSILGFSIDSALALYIFVFTWISLTTLTNKYLG